MDLSRSLYGDLAGGDTAAHEHLSDVAFLNAIVEFEGALADAAERAGIIDPESALAARTAVAGFEVDAETLAAIAVASAAGGNPAIPLAAELKRRAGEHPGGVHVGATSQDAIDTALVLCSRRAISVLDGELTGVEALLAELARTHRDTPVMGRTLGQQALPTTFGAVVVGWLEGVQQASAALSAAAAALPVQYAGATGNLVATHPDGVKVHDLLAEGLGLAATPVVWHTNRQPLVAVGVSAARVAGAVRKIAGDVVAYSATEIGELAEATPGGSSSMPHKANPAAAVACDGYARRTPALAATLLDALDCRWQRGVGSWHAEWQTLRDLLAATASAVSRIRTSLDGIRVDTDAMARNIALTGHDLNNLNTGHAGDIVDAVLRPREGHHDGH
ncbi:lyase family protein [Corynebacterium comes]|uniref:3-carboxy-cis,cis-muconate cycloisomerase n=1 Tax=Corynebacterium comes TaxID=2675218 RepID=A0A6B8VIX0_9CORY|nr:lyase family protein [Corynebacterium comes]QGU05312.1 3-carboxy-cis,cis-muconate cycloisomerase [Corynebacterium comes]